MSNKMNRGKPNGIVEQHAQMRSYLQHRQRVMNAAPRVQTRQKPRSKSVAARTPDFKTELQTQQMNEENIRLLNALVTISRRQSELGPSAHGRSKSVSRSSISSASTANYSRESGSLPPR